LSGQESAQSWSPAFFEARGSRHVPPTFWGQAQATSWFLGLKAKKGQEEPRETRAGPLNVGGRCSGPSREKLRPGTLPILVVIFLL